MADVKVSWPAERVAPESVGMCSKRLKRVSEVIARAIAEGKIAGGITAVARRGGIAHLECAGKADIERGTPMREDALFRIYSMTKLVTSSAVLMLMEEGWFLLKDPVKRWLPEFGEMKVAVTGADGKEELVRLKRDITIHDLLTHTAGFGYDLVQTARDNAWSLEKFVSEFCRIPLKRQPGIMWDYSAATDILGRFVEVVSGKAFDVFLKERFFGPLEMVDTDFWVPPAKAERLAQVYRPKDGGGLEIADDLGCQKFLSKGFLSGGGGLISSTSDYLRFSMMLLNGGELNGVRLLGRKTVELMHEDALPPGHSVLEINGASFGLGVSVVLRPADTKQLMSVGEFGWGGAACTQVYIDPAEQMVSIIMLQLRPKERYLLMDLFKNAAYQAIVD